MSHRDLFTAAATLFIVAVAAAAISATPRLSDLDRALTPPLAPGAPTMGGPLYSSRPPVPIDPPA
jgi:hypothetical protein